LRPIEPGDGQRSVMSSSIALSYRRTAGPRAARPIPEGHIDRGNRYSLAQRVQALTLLSEGFSIKQVESKLRIPARTVRNIRQKAHDRGYRPEEDPRILEHHVEDGLHPGRPKEIDSSVEIRLLDSVRKDRNGREKSSEVLAYEAGISPASALRILQKYGLTNVKPTRKPGLNKAQKAARFAFCHAHQHWTLEDWKNVIWSDETSVIMGIRRGTVRVWRTPDEAVDSTVIRNRWKGFSEFMFWGCFSYDKRGPCHIWRPETVAMKKEAQREIDIINAACEQDLKAEWELLTGLRRLRVTRNVRGSKPTWKFNARTGKLGRRQGNGIDWYRYWKVSQYS